MSLKKELGLIDVFSLATGAMISSGIFILPGIAFAQAGPSVFVSYFIAGLLALTGAFSIVELSSAMPKAGGDYFFITRSLGPMFGTVSGIMSWFALSLKTAFAVIGIAEILFFFWGFNVFMSSIALTVFFVLLNIVGVKEAGKFEVLIVMALLAIMGLHVVMGLPLVEVSQFEPFAPMGVNALFLTAGFVFVAYGGLLKVASVAEEVKDPKRTIPAGIFLSLFVTTTLYSLITLIAVGTVDAAQLAGSLTPIADSAVVSMGEPGRILLTVAAMLAFVSTGNAGIMAASRYPYALGSDRLLPAFCAKVLPKSGTPIVAVALTGLLIAVSFFLTLDVLVKVASTVVIVTYILSQVSIIILRESGLQNYRPSFRAPLYPWIQLISIAVFILLLLDMGQTVMFISLGAVFVGVVFYFAYGRIFNSSEYALLHILRRITHQKIGTPALSRELKEILNERDEVTFDRFDHLVNNASVLDFKHALSLDAFIDTVAGELARITGKGEAEMARALREREEETSTAITPSVAIPHVILDGENLFHLVIVRCREGISFSDTHRNVSTAFVLAGTLDERNFHLQALSAIAQIVLKPEFHRRWEEARTQEQLRDIIHLSERQRFHIIERKAHK